jgi:hypothetical protein
VSELVTGAALLETLKRTSARAGTWKLAPLEGLERGCLIELCGARSSGRFSIALSAMAAATKAGDAAAFVDGASCLDPQAAEAAGVELSRLLWLRPRAIKPALACAEMALAAGLALVVLDISGFSARGVADAAWWRLARASRAQNAALLLVSARPVARAAAEAVVRAARARPLWRAQRPGQTPLLAGLSVRLTIERRHGGPARERILALPVRGSA